MKQVKIFTAASLFLFTITVVGLLTAASLNRSNKKVATDNGVLIGLNGVTQAGLGNTDSGSGGSASASFLTLTEVAKHSSNPDCWMVIDGAVYNLTPFLAAHPGGAGVMLPYCGKDGSAAFATKDKSPASKHSVIAQRMLAQYFVGRLGAQLASAEPVPATDPGTPTLAPRPLSLLLITPTRVPTTAVATVSNSNLSLTTAEVARHNNLSDCWLIISGRVYNVTSYITQHPGGADAIARHCGSDATTAFATKDYGAPHSSAAQGLLNNYLIGSVGSSVPVTQPTPTNPPVPTTPPSGNPNPTATPRPGSPTAAPVPPTPIPSNLILDATEVGRHNTLSNCWLIISNRVYDVTRYITQHPGGASAITNMCGRESTSAFQTKGGRGSNHSTSAYNLLNNYFIGNFNSSVPVVPTATPVPTTPPGQPTNTPVPGAPTNTPAPNPTTPPQSSNLPQAILNKYPGATRQSGGYEDNGSWEGKINTSSGACRSIKVNSSGTITEDKNC